MRKTLEDVYYGNLTPGEQEMRPNSELKRAVDRVTRFESQLTEQLDEAGQTVLTTERTSPVFPQIFLVFSNVFSCLYSSALK